MVSKKTSVKKTAPSKKTSVPAPAPVVVHDEPAPVKELASVNSSVLETSNTDNMFQSILNDLQTQKTAITQLINTVKKLQKDYQREVKAFKKKKQKGTGKKREPSGFAKPAKISKELCSFLGKSEGTEMARTEVTRYLTEYIKQHNLQFAEDKRKIIPDDKLKKLLFKNQKEAEVTYFNLQKWMKPHFEKSSSSK